MRANNEKQDETQNPDSSTSNVIVATSEINRQQLDTSSQFCSLPSRTLGPSNPQLPAFSPQTFPHFRLSHMLEYSDNDFENDSESYNDSSSQNESTSTISTLSQSSAGPYYVPQEVVTLRHDNPPHTDIDHTNSLNIDPNSNVDTIIPQAEIVTQSWLNRPVFAKYPRLTFFRLFNSCILLTLLIIALNEISIAVVKNKNDHSLSISFDLPSQAPSISPTNTPLSWEWKNETILHLYEEKADKNELMGYRVSLSGDGNTIAVAGYQTLALYGKNSWAQVVDFTDLASSKNTMADLSWRIAVSLSSDGHALIVGDELADVPYTMCGAVMVFSNLNQNNDIVEWYQVGSTISGSGINYRLGGQVSIADVKTRIAIGANNHGVNGIVYDYDGSEWRVRMKLRVNHLLYSLVLSPNGALLASHNNFDNVVEIYDLTTFAKIDVIHGIEINHMGHLVDIKWFGHSISFSNDASIVAIGSWKSSQVNLYQFNLQKQEYEPMGPGIKIANVEGFGYSVSVAGNGRSVAVGAVSPPSLNFMDNGLSVFDDHYDFWLNMTSKTGSVHVFRIQNNSWEQISEFNHENSIYDKVGYSVSLSKDGKMLAFGAYGTGGVHGDGPYKNGQVSIYRSEPIS